jgi:phosphomannomutase
MHLTISDSIDSVIKRDDIRSKYPYPLNEDTAFYVGMTLINTLFTIPSPRIAIGWDSRLSSPALSRSLMQGLIAGGAKIEQIGLCSTEMIYFAVCNGDADGGVMVTASHNPKDENGLKIVKQHAEPISNDDLQRIAQAIKQLSLEQFTHHLDLYDRYSENAIRISGIRSHSAIPSPLNSFKLVVEAGNGVGAHVFKHIAKRLPFLNIIYSNDKPDGHFPIRLPNPLDPHYMNLLSQRVIAEKAVLGLAFDGDADRVGVVDACGTVLNSAEISALIVKLLDRKVAKQKIMYNIVSSQLIADLARSLGHTPQMTPVGHGQIKLRMRRPENADCVFAAEHSGHYFFRDFYQCDSGIIAGLMCIEASMSALDKQSNLHDEIAHWRQRYFLSGEINFDFGMHEPNASSTKALREHMQTQVSKIKTHYSKQGQVVTNYALNDPILPSQGVEILKMTFTEAWGTWWLCVRPSGNEPLLRVMLEVILSEDHIGKTDGNALLNALTEEVTSKISTQLT